MPNRFQIAQHQLAYDFIKVEPLMVGQQWPDAAPQPQRGILQSMLPQWVALRSLGIVLGLG